MKKPLLLIAVIAISLVALYPHLLSSKKLDLNKPANPVLDNHVHVAGLGYGDSGCFLGKSLRDSYKLPFYLRAFDINRELLQERGDAIVIEQLAQKIASSHYIDSAIVLALDGRLTPTGEIDRERTEIYVPNDFVAREVAKHKVLRFGASINPLRLDAIARLEQAKRDGAVLVKWIPCIMGFDPADRRFIPFYQKLIALKLPLLSHAGQERAFSQSEDRLCDPLRLKLPLELGVTVIAAHIATTGSSEGEDNFMRILPLFEQYPNLYSEISSLTQINKRGYLVRALQQPDITNRLIYGSDWPLQMFPVVSPFYHLETISLRDAFTILSFNNQWDRDFLLKRAMGTPDPIFERSSILLNPVNQ